VKLVILLEAESQENDPQPIQNLFRYPQPAHFPSLYHSLVEYWRIAVRAENKRAQDLILQSFNYLIQTNCYVSRRAEQNPAEFVSDIYLIERELGEVDPVPVAQGVQTHEYSVPIENRFGWSQGFIRQKELNIFYSELLSLRPWLIPWIIRVASSDVREKAINQIEGIPNEDFQYSILQYQLIENPAVNLDDWLEILNKIIQQHASNRLVSLLARALAESNLKISDETLETLLVILHHDIFNEDIKHSLIASTETCSLTRRQKERIRQVLLDAPKMKQKYYFALASLHNIPNVDLESLFSEIEQTLDYKWMSFLLRRIVKEKATEIVRERFLILPLGCINIIETQLLRPQTYFHFEGNQFRSYEVRYLDDVSVERLRVLCEEWWCHYLASTTDAVEILDEILEPWDAMLDDSDYMRVSFDYQNVFERLVAWISLRDRKSQSEFLMACIKKKLDFALPTYRKIIQPLLDALLDDEIINLELVELYKNRPFFLLDIWKKETWTKYIDRFPRDAVETDERFFHYLIEAGGINSVDDAIHAIEINPEIVRYQDTSEPLINWVLSRPHDIQVSFVTRILDFEISLVYLSKLITKLTPISKYPHIHRKLVQIARSRDIIPYPYYIREKPEGHLLPNHEIAYHLISLEEKMKIIRPKFDRLLMSDLADDENVNNILVEYLRLAKKRDLKKAADFFDRYPFHVDSICIDDKEKLQALQSMLRNPISKIAAEIYIPGLDEFVKNVNEAKAQNYLAALNADDSLAYLSRNLAFRIFNEREDLRNLIIEMMDMIPIEWEHHYHATGWIETILTKGKDTHMEFVAKKMDSMDSDSLIKVYRSIIFGKNETFYPKLLLVLDHMESKASVVATIASAAYLGKKTSIDVSELWSTPQFKSLDSKSRIDLKSGRWFAEHLDNSLKGDWSFVAW
jgi:hypothetical protein